MKSRKHYLKKHKERQDKKKETKLAPAYDDKGRIAENVHIERWSNKKLSAQIGEFEDRVAKDIAIKGWSIQPRDTPMDSVRGIHPEAIWVDDQIAPDEIINKWKQLTRLHPEPNNAAFISTEDYNLTKKPLFNPDNLNNPEARYEEIQSDKTDKCNYTILKDKETGNIMIGVDPCVVGVKIPISKEVSDMIKEEYVGELSKEESEALLKKINQPFGEVEGIYKQSQTPSKLIALPLDKDLHFELPSQKIDVNELRETIKERFHLERVRLMNELGSQYVANDCDTFEHSKKNIIFNDELIRTEPGEPPKTEFMVLAPHPIKKTTYYPMHRPPWGKDKDPYEEYKEAEFDKLNEQGKLFKIAIEEEEEE